MVFSNKKILVFFASLFAVSLFLLSIHYLRTQKSKASTGENNIYAPQLLQHEVEVDTTLTKNTSKVKVLIYLQRPITTSKVTSLNRATRLEERKNTYDELKLRTNVIQQKVLSSLKNLQDTNKLVVKKTFFVDNIILADLDQEAIETLKNTPGVLKIIPDYQIELEPMIQVTTATPEWNIAKIGADRVWSELGITGQGVTVANIDTGVQWDHPALKQKYRGFDGVNVNNDYNWYDPTSTSPISPLDNVGHGTHVMGTIVGSEGVNNIGVAPGAKWIAAKGCATTVCYASDLIASGQWMLAPTKIDGTNPDPVKAPDVINNSWGSAGCDLWYQGVIQSWRNAGIVPVFSGGNSGSNPSTIGSPGDNPEAIAVGAVDIVDNIANFSSRGPTCSAFGTKIKPDIAAPGVSVRSSIPENSYMNLNGTSMAAPHVTGLVALILQANPNLTVNEIQNIITSSVTDLGIGGLDYNYGAGLINTYKAIQLVPSPTVYPTISPPYPIRKIEVIQPNGTEKLSPGQQYSVKWNSQNVDQVMIDLIDGNGAFSTISLAKSASDGEFIWTVPTSWYGTSHAYKIKVYENPASGVFDISDSFFYIMFPTPTPSPTRTPTPTQIKRITLISPNLATPLAKGSLTPIQWTSTGISGVDIINLDAYDSYNRVFSNTIETNRGANDSFLWNVSTYNLDRSPYYTVKYKIRVVGGFPPITDSSDQYFTIVSPSPTPTPTITPTPTKKPTPTPTRKPRYLSPFPTRIRLE